MALSDIAVLDIYTFYTLCMQYIQLVPILMHLLGLTPLASFLSVLWFTFLCNGIFMRTAIDADHKVVFRPVGQGEHLPE